jgi:hypothetical protein
MRPLMASLDTLPALQVRQRLGRKVWGVPLPFGPAGWKFDRLDGGARILLTSGPAADDEDCSGGDWWHASISGKDRMPTYEELSLMHRAVWPNGWAYQVFAPPADHINLHAHVLHLWGRPDGAIQLPQFGAKGMI